MISFGLVRRAAGAAAIAAAFAVPAVAHAQTPLNVSVTVNTALSVSVQQALLFGVLVPGSNLTIDAQTSASAGRYEISGTGGSTVNVSITYPATLTDGTNTVNLSTYSASSSATVGGARSVINTPVGQVISGTVVLNGGGLVEVWIGGKVTIPALAPANTYSGTVSMTANY